MMSVLFVIVYNEGVNNYTLNTDNSFGCIIDYFGMKKDIFLQKMFKKVHIR